MILYPDCDLIQDHMVSCCDECYRFDVCKKAHDEERKDDE